MFTVKDLAERYGVGLNTVLAWIHSGELKAIQIAKTPRPGKPRWRITEAAVAAFEAARTPAAPPPREKRRKRKAEGVISFY